MEFEIDIKHGLNGHVEITDYSKEYGQYYEESTEGMTSPDKFKYSESCSINVILQNTTSKMTLIDVLLNNHMQDLDQSVFDVSSDGYFVIQHFVLPTQTWFENQLKSSNSLLANYSTIYYISGETLYKRVITSEDTGNHTYKYNIGDAEEVAVRELLERNTEGTTIQKCQIDIFYTGYLQECYINHCKELFNSLMANCQPNCKPKNVDTFSRDFLWMTLNVIDYLIERGQFFEAQRILESVNYCGGFCNNTNNNESVCGCNKTVSRSSCGCSQR